MVAVSIIVFSLMLNFQIILGMINQRLEHIHQLSKIDAISTYANTLVERWQPDVVVDFSEFNLVPLDVDRTEKHAIKLVGVEELRKYAGFDWLWGFAIQKWVPPDEEGRLFGCKRLEGKGRILLMVGQRLIKHRDIWQVSLRDWLESVVEKECEGWHIVYYNLHTDINYVVLEDFSTSRFGHTLNADPTFQNAGSWQGRFQISENGVIVGPGPENANVLSQRIRVQPSQPLKSPR